MALGGKRWEVRLSLSLLVPLIQVAASSLEYLLDFVKPSTNHMVFLGSSPTEATFENHDKSVSLHIGVTEVLRHCTQHGREEDSPFPSVRVEEGQFN